MTDRGRPPVDASFACPFVALEDDRDARSDVPDPRHRCFAELRPAPRAIAHQQAYCLSSGFAACPTFIDWAQREAARVRPAGRSGGDAGLAAAGLAGTAAMAAAHGDEPDAGHETMAEPPVDDQVWPRRSEREWASPPPWGADQEGAEEDLEDEDEDETAPPAFLADRGTSDHAGDRADESRPGAAAAGAAAGAAAAGAVASSRPSPYLGPEDDVDEQVAPRYAPEGRRPTDRRRGERPAGTSIGGPSWEAPRRYEAYPAIRSPRSMPNLSPLLLAVAALVIGALALFFIPPFLLGLGGSSSPTPTLSPSASAGVASPTVAASASAAAAPSSGPATYSVKQGDTMTSIAKAHGVDVNALIAANPQIKNPNQLKIGDQLTIPTPSPSVIQAVSPSPSP